MTTQEWQPRWYHITPDRFFIGPLVVQVLLFLSEQFQWFPFNEKKGWTVLIAVGVVGVAVVVMLVWGLVCLVLRRRFQFCFRSLLLFLVVVSVPLGRFAWEMQRAKRQRATVERIVALGGTVIFDYEVDERWMPINGAKTFEPAWLRQFLGDDFFHDVKAVSCDETGFGDNDARHLKELTKLELLYLDNTQITDNGLAHLEGLTKLKDLSLDRTHVTDDGLLHLEGLTKLEGLDLNFTQITDNGLEHLKGMTQLKALGLNSTDITDKGLEHLKGMTKLENLRVCTATITDNGLGHLRGMTKLEALWLGGTQITDKGLAHLEGLTELEHLYLVDTHVTKEGVTKLQQALPNCEIDR